MSSTEVKAVTKHRATILDIVRAALQNKPAATFDECKLAVKQAGLGNLYPVVYGRGKSLEGLTKSKTAARATKKSKVGKPKAPKRPGIEKGKSTRKYSHYSEDFKATVVQEWLDENRDTTLVALNNNVHPSLIRNWVIKAGYQLSRRKHKPRSRPFLALAGKLGGTTDPMASIRQLVSDKDEAVSMLNKVRRMLLAGMTAQEIQDLSA